MGFVDGLKTIMNGNISNFCKKSADTQPCQRPPVQQYLLIIIIRYKIELEDHQDLSSFS